MQDLADPDGVAAEDEGYEEGGPEGRLVEIRCSASEVPRVWEVRFEDGEETEQDGADVDGQRGLCIGRLEEESEDFLVQTLDGLFASVREENLSTCVPAAVEDGGFDAVWPAHAAEQDLDGGLVGDVCGSLLSDALLRRGYCVAHLPMARRLSAEASQQGQVLQSFDRLRRETEIDYLGRDNRTKAWQLPQDDPGLEPETALGICDRLLTELGRSVCDNMDPEALGYELLGRTPALARMRYADQNEETELSPGPCSDEEVQDGYLQPFFEFLQSRKVCMLLILGGADAGGAVRGDALVSAEAGEVTLLPMPGFGDEVTLPVSRGRVVLFRHDIMSYSYNPKGGCVALQAWLSGGVIGAEMRKLSGTAKGYADLLNITGPWQPEGDQAYIKSLMVRMPGRSWGYQAYWNMFTAGTDCPTEWDGVRWDVDVYYEPDRDKAMLEGRSYMHHGGFLDQTEFMNFDNTFFGISEDEAQCMYPGQRIVLETGYEALWRAGYTKHSTNGERIGVHLGDVGPDWHSVKDSWVFGMSQGEDFTNKRLGVSATITSSRMSHILNLVGPISSVATACSSSLVALNIAHHQMLNIHADAGWREADEELNEKHLIVGINTLMGPVSFMGQCTSGGTTYKGRCFTFDTGADGYQRGEGCSATFMQLKRNEKQDIDRLGTMIGSFVNQDGRSASLTAPNGPSQSALLKNAMRLAKMSPPEVTACECHGTGTALGDPIEIGALQNVLKKRTRSILKTSAKSNMAHLEASAGMAGFAKCIMMILAAATPPNVHLKAMNAHLLTDGYPVFFASELTPWGQNSGYCGVSSFGIGGTNARGEVLGRCQRGPEATGAELNERMLTKVDFVTIPCPRCLGPMTYPDGAAVPRPCLSERHRPSLIRDELADYTTCSQCYEGRFRSGEELEEAGNPYRSVHIKGSWDAFQTLEEMDEIGTGTYVFHVALGETLCERFTLCLEKEDQLLAIYPTRDGAGPHVRIQGPDDNEGFERHWLIDGRDKEVAAGTIYRIIFEWSPVDGRKSMTWTQLEEAEEVPEKVAGRGEKHRYQLVGSWTSYQHSEMKSVSEGEYSATFRIGPYGREEFQIVRDHDRAQILYPGDLPFDHDPSSSLGGATSSSQGRSESTSERYSISGPNCWAGSRRWRVFGQEGETVSVSLTAMNGVFTVQAKSRSLGSRTWTSVRGWARQRYFLTGLFNHGGLAELEPMGESAPGALMRRITLEDYTTEFQIVVDANLSLILYPQVNGADSGLGFLEGLPEEGNPDVQDSARGGFTSTPSLVMMEGQRMPGESAMPQDSSQGRCWLIKGAPGDIVDIVLDLSEQDRRRMVTWRHAWDEELGDDEEYDES